MKTITAFTIGHSASLAAAAFGLIGVPERPLNACIALSIVFIGVEIVKQQRGEIGLTARYPWAVAFTFGLVHGIGFAGALAGLGLERRLLPIALLFFNIGVEIGQLAFVLAGAGADLGPSAARCGRCRAGAKPSPPMRSARFPCSGFSAACVRCSLVNRAGKRSGPMSRRIFDCLALHCCCLVSPQPAFAHERGRRRRAGLSAGCCIR